MNKNIIVYSLNFILIILIIYLFLGFRQLSSTVSDNDPQSPTSSIPPNIDLSKYYTKSDIDSSFSTKSYVDTNIQNSISTIRTDQGGNMYSVAGNKEIGYEVDIDGKFNFNSPVEFKEHVGLKNQVDFTDDVRFHDPVDFTDEVRFNNNVRFNGNHGAVFDIDHKNGERWINTLPKGSIIAWNRKFDNSGAKYGSDIPRGWAPCDGNWYKPDKWGFYSSGVDKDNRIIEGATRTPDLRGRFILGAGQGTDGLTNRDELYVKGGAEKVALGDTNIPKHNHTIKLHPWNGNGSWEAYQKSGKGDGPQKDYNTSTWGGKSETDWNAEPHNNMPPYNVLTYIIKI